MGANSKVFKVKMITEQGARDLKFDHAEGYSTTVGKYFAEKYNKMWATL